MKTPTLLVALCLTACGGPRVVSLGEAVTLAPDACIAGAFGGRVWAAVQQGAQAWGPFGGHFNATGGAPLRVACNGSSAAIGEWNGQEVSLNPSAWSGELLGGVNFDAAIASLVTHELGHAMELVHVKDPFAVMYPYANLAAPNATDAQQLCEIYPGSNACSHAAGGLWPDPTP